jgi:cytochrome c peroxidase
MGRRIGHKRSLTWWIPLAISVVVAGFVARQPAFPWDIPTPFPRPPVPSDNPMSVAKVELGRRLFYDARLSVTRAQSCGSCHRQEFAFTDGAAQATGTTGEVHPRGSMSLANVAYSPALAWANPTMQSLEQQALVPMLGTNPVEMGMHGLEGRLISELRADTLYQRLFPRAFPTDDSVFTVNNVARAIASFERTMLSMRSPYDRYRYGGDTNAISASAKRGEAFFFSGQKGACLQCHGGWNFSGGIRYEARPDAPPTFFNTGLYNVAGEFSYPEPNTGLHEFTKRPQDVGKFRAPTLRNIAVTAPYMHDGSIATLGAVLEHYAAGGRTVTSGVHAGVGRDNPNKAPNVRGFAMTAADKRDLIAFLETLTDSTFLKNRALSDPWIAPRR